MATENPPPPEKKGSEETQLLRQEVAAQKAEAEVRQAKESQAERLKNRVSVAAIILTTALTFIGNIKSDRADASGSAKSSAEGARKQAAELWAYYQTKLSERTELELARDRVRLNLSQRGLSRSSPEARLDALALTNYEERIRDFDQETQRVFFRIQDLERQQDMQERAAFEPGRAAFRYDLGGKLITLALILLSVTILSNKEWLLWAGVSLGAVGLLVAFNAYFLFF